MVHARTMAPLPTPVRAALGLAAVAVEQARKFPDRAVELPVLVVSTALQFSLRAQQRYAELAMRGDDVLGRLREPPEEPPSWATFDDETPEAQAPGDGRPDDSPPGDSPPDDSASQPPRHRGKAARPPKQAEPSAFDRAAE